MDIKEIFCCQCQVKVSARLTNGSETYPHRTDLHDIPFWKCDECNNFVGCHHKTKNRTKPLGIIPTEELKNARKHIHNLLDPIWNNSPDKKQARIEVYAYLSGKLNFNYHTAMLRTIEEAKQVYKLLIQYKKNYE